MIGVIVLAVGGLLWSLWVAASNERLAARERLSRAYRGYAEAGKAALADHWREFSQGLASSEDASGSVGQRFVSIVEDLGADAVLIYDEDGVLRYPTLLPEPAEEATMSDARWAAAQKAEFQDGEFIAAAAIFGAIAGDAVRDDRPDEAMLAWRSETRCLLRGGGNSGALDRFRSNAEHGFDALDRDGRSMRAGTALAVFEALQRDSPTDAKAVGEQLAEWVADYSADSIPASQRRFLMAVLESAGVAKFPTRSAEDLAARVLLAERGGRWGDGLHATALADVVSWSDASTRCEVLLRRDTLHDWFERSLLAVGAPADAQLSVSEPGAASENVLVSTDAGKMMPGWRIDVAMDEAALANLGGQRIAVYTLVGAGVVLALVLLAWLVARGFLKQLRRAQIKHDLAATVSHELKTPLASMRLLVDVLLEGDSIDEARAREYLGMIAAENARLSHLVENFLAYARIEKGPGAATIEPLAPGEVLQATAAAIGRRYGETRIEIDVEPGLPQVETDGEALGTALLNLADNACKYSPEESAVKLSCARHADGDLCFGVEDSGAGLTDSQLERAFESFARIDENLDTPVGGCGLGLFIVRRLVGRIGGRLVVSSHPGEGSQFNILLAPR